MDTLVEYTMVSDDVGCIAGHEQAIEVRIDELTDSWPGRVPFISGITTSVISRSMRPACSLAKRMASPGVAGWQDSVALDFEHLLGHVEDHGFVFHQQNGFMTAAQQVPLHLFVLPALFWSHARGR